MIGMEIPAFGTTGNAGELREFHHAAGKFRGWAGVFHNLYTYGRLSRPRGVGD